MDEFLNNDFITTIWEDDKVLVRTVSYLKLESSLDDFVKKFINLETFPYVNTTYGKLLKDSFKTLNTLQRMEIRKIIDCYLHEIESKEHEWFLSLDNRDLLSMGFNQTSIDSTSKEDMFREIKGGYYCEMLLANILISLGYEIILSKLYFQYGSFSPTGIDVPFIDLHKKVLILGECKLYKNIKSAIKSCYSDLSNIYDKDKFHRDFDEWIKKLKCTNESFADYVVSNELDTFTMFLSSINKVVCIGFVIGNEIELEQLKSCLIELEDFAQKDRIHILLITIPVESKDEFVKCCYNGIKMIGDSIYDG